MELEKLRTTSDGFCEEDGIVVRSERKEQRDHWGNRIQFLLAIVGYTVGIGSIWRFPILCARNGGGAFLIPFFFFLITCGAPLYYMEVFLGQFSGRSAATAFDFCPLLKGVGLLMVVLSYNVMWYYINIMGWVQYYLVNSFATQLPWTTCGNWWNTDNCRESSYITANNNNNTMTDADIPYSNEIGNLTQHNFTSAASEFWMYNVLRKSSGLEEMGSLQLHLVISNFIGWIIVSLCLIKGVQSLGKVVYVTATAPYVILTIILVRGLTLDGSIEGIVWYVTPSFEKLASPQVWLEAAVQVFYSLGPAYGGVITMASHNKFNQKSARETLICVIADGFTAFYAGFVVFSIIGFMAKESGSTVEEIAKNSGPGLAFVAYPEAVSRMPLPQLWAVLFFVMLITTALDTAFGTIETVTHGIIDMFPKQLHRHQMLVLIVTTSSLFLLGLPFSTQGGIYLFQLADWYTCSFALMAGGVLECTMLSWIYGADRFSCNIEMMTDRPVGKLLRITWCILIPICLLTVFFITLTMYTSPDYGDGYVYNTYAIVLGMLIGLSPFIPVFLAMVYELYKAEGSIIQRVTYLLKPRSNWAPHDATAQEIYHLRPYVYGNTLRKRIMTNILGNKDTPWF
ncbi:hypothetical protein ACF0H5_001050 [Mactra antiquata]